MKLPLPLLAALLLMCVLLPCCKQEKGCTDLQANNYNNNATGEAERGTCNYGAISFYSTIVDTIYEIKPEVTDSTGTTPADTIRGKEIQILLDKTTVGILENIGGITTKINGSPICYLPQMKIFNMEGIDKRRIYTWSANMVLTNGETIYDVKHGTLEPTKDCQTLQVYP